jgi:hypothetical protein
MMFRAGIGVAVLALTSLDGFAQTHESAAPARGKVPRVSTVVREQQPVPPAPAAGAAAPHEGTASSAYVATGAPAPKTVAAHTPRRSRPIVSGFRPESADASHDAGSDSGQAPTGAAAPDASSERDHAASGAASTARHGSAAPAAVTATFAKTSIADQAHAQAPPAARAESAVKPTKLSEVHSRIAAALAELALAAKQSGDDPEDGAPTASAARPAPRIRLEWPLPHLELEWPDALQPGANRPPAAAAPAPRSH